MHATTEESVHQQVKMRLCAAVKEDGEVLDAEVFSMKNIVKTRSRNFNFLLAILLL